MLQLRDYQLACVEHAKKRNTIVHLRTGCGKTLIAAYLINHCLEKDLEKKIAFLVPTRALVDQQSSYLNQHCSVSGSPPTIQTLIGSDQDRWERSDWANSMKCHIYVGTAALFLQAFVTNKFLDVRRFSLLVFDECHNATGNSPMASLMLDGVTPLYAAGDAEAPRILGLTASFNNGKHKNIEKKKKDLEALMQSTFFTPVVPASRIDDDKYKQIHWKLGEYVQDQKQCIEQHIEDAVSHLAQIKDMAKVLRSCSHVFEELGSKALFFYIDKVIVKQIEEKAKLLQDMEQSKGLARKLMAELPYLQQHVDILAEKLKCDTQWQSGDTKSSKLETLVALLREIFQNNEDAFRGIVFVEQVCLVSALAKMLNDEFNPIHCFGAVAGSGYQAERDRQDQLEKFKCGELKALVSTAALEEGIDVSECGFVIRYTSIATTKAHIQGSGRARHRNAVIYYFDNNPTVEQAREADLNSVAMNKDISLIASELEAAALSMTFSASVRHPYPFPTSDAISTDRVEGQVNVFNCKQIFNTYCSMSLRTTVPPKKHLYNYCNKPGEQKVLASIRYPTPEGWMVMSSEGYREFWQDESTRIKLFASSTRSKRSDQEEMCFVYAIVVTLREVGYLDERNLPNAARRLDTLRNCPLVKEEQREISITNRVIQSSDDL